MLIDRILDRLRKVCGPYVMREIAPFGAGGAMLTATHWLNEPCGQFFAALVLRVAALPA